jgi:redox-sensitive bicupin YhaK (pirin superfamily)
MLQIRTRESLSGGNYGWLQARHHFAVDARAAAVHGPLGCLVVWNDDEIAPGTGFPMHGHANMEIITYVRTAAVAHEDSLGNVGRIEAGDVQVMSAGAGIRHQERNPTDQPLKIFQIWIRPRQDGGAPRWDSRKFPKADRAGQLVAHASGDRTDGEALPIRADARVLGATLLAGGSITHQITPSRHAYLVAARGVSSSMAGACSRATASLPLARLRSPSQP